MQSPFDNTTPTDVEDPNWRRASQAWHSEDEIAVNVEWNDAVRVLRGGPEVGLEVALQNPDDPRQLVCTFIPVAVLARLMASTREGQRAMADSLLKDLNDRLGQYEHQKDAG